MLGKWKNFDELESELNLDELGLILEAVREQEMNRMRFQAALQGIDIDKDSKSSDEVYDRALAKAQARLTGKTQEEVELEEMGIEIIDEEE